MLALPGAGHLNETAGRKAFQSKRDQRQPSGKTDDGGVCRQTLLDLAKSGMAHVAVRYVSHSGRLVNCA